MSIATELDALIDEHGELLQAATVVEWARSHPKSALHNAPQFMGWDTEKLAAAKLLDGARTLLRLHIESGEYKPRLVSLTIDRSREGGGYRQINDVVNDRSLYEIMIEDALRALTRLQEKYSRIVELRPAWAEVAKLRRRMDRRKSKTKGGAEKRASA